MTRIFGKSNYVDVLSRLSIGEFPKHQVQTTDDIDYIAVVDAIEAALNPKEIEGKSAKDPTLRSVAE